MAEENKATLKELFETNPFFVGNMIINEIKNYNTLIPCICKATKHINKFCKDVVVF